MCLLIPFFLIFTCRESESVKKLQESVMWQESFKSLGYENV